jgi:hypothetical protein
MPRDVIAEQAAMIDDLLDEQKIMQDQIQALLKEIARLDEIDALLKGIARLAEKYPRSGGVPCSKI